MHSTYQQEGAMPEQDHETVRRSKDGERWLLLDSSGEVAATYTSERSALVELAKREERRHA